MHSRDVFPGCFLYKTAASMQNPPVFLLNWKIAAVPPCKNTQQTSVCGVFVCHMSERSAYFPHFSCRYLSMASAAFLPAPMARMTVAAPVTASPPA